MPFDGEPQSAPQPAVSSLNGSVNMDAELDGDQDTGHATMASIDAWALQQRQHLTGQLAALSTKEQQILDQIASLDEQLQVVAQQRHTRSTQLEQLPIERARRVHQTIANGLRKDAAVLQERGDWYQQANQQRDAQIRSLRSAPGIAEKLEEYAAFEERREQLLAAVPPGYHQALLSQHAQLYKSLAPFFASMRAALPPIDAPLHTLSVVAALDEVDGRIESLVVILPVAYAMYEAGSAEEDELAAVFATRMVTAIRAAMQAVGGEDAPVICGPYTAFGDEQLVVQIWLRDVDLTGDVAVSVVDTVSSVHGHAEELNSTALQVTVVWLSPEMLAPEPQRADLD